MNTAVRSAARESCAFCAIIEGRQPATVVRVWANAIAIVPLNPVTAGHLLVIPTLHVPDFTTDPQVTAGVMWAASELASVPANLITSAGTEATQTVMHLHVHLVPRADGDGLALPWTHLEGRTPGGSASSTSLDLTEVEFDAQAAAGEPVMVIGLAATERAAISLQKECIGIDPDCVHCERSLQHGDRKCDALCEMKAELISTTKGHAALHETQHCRKCGEWQTGYNGISLTVRRPCRLGRCTNWHCPSCDAIYGGNGPIDCRCEATWWDRLKSRIRGRSTTEIDEGELDD